MANERSTRDQLIAQIRYSVTRERYSQFRYREAAKLALNDQVRQLLLGLANEEQAHEEKLRRLLERIQKTADPA